ncbi:MAG: amino acid racemase [Syntrophaceae bacterium]
MPEKVIGVLGGMGPEATANFYKELVAHTLARKDQEHLHVLIDSNPKIPDRTLAIFQSGESPLPAMVMSASALERAGADFIVMPCVSAHFFVEELERSIKLPILSIVRAVADHITLHHPGIEKIGLLATNGTIQGGFFQEQLKRGGLETLIPAGDDQRLVMSAIYDVKDIQCHRSREEIAEDICAVAFRLVARGAQGIIAACTEIPLVLDAGKIPAPAFNSLLILAKAAIEAAGGRFLP